MEKRPRKRKFKTALALVLLAVVCIGAAELVACRYFAPALYQRITQPVRDTLAGAAALCSQGVERVKEAVSGLAEGKPEEELPEDQHASQPMLEYLQAEADPAVTRLKSQDGLEILTGGSIPLVYYNQGDEQWAQQAYGSDHIGGYGCGPTAMAMVVSSMTQEVTDPAQMAEWAVENGHWARKRGSYSSIVEGAARAFGLSAGPACVSGPEALRLELATGNILVALMAPGHFTQSGHFIVLRGVTQDGSILVADPNSDERSVTTWDAQLILDELSKNRGYGGPLWSISRKSPE